jgi:thiamine-phosphate pyrophosphorylase
VNDRVDVARLCHADGVHLGQQDVPPAAARDILDASAVIGWSTHSTAQARAALELPIDYIAVGPVFGTQTKNTGYREVGLSTIREVRALLDQRKSRLPIVAIGGVTLEHARDVIGAGAASVAVISDLLSSGNPAQRVREYLRTLGARFEELQ